MTIRAASACLAPAGTFLVLVLASCGSGETRRGPPPASRVLILALDAATWSVADPLLAAVRMPNLAGLIERGVRAPLATLEPTVSPAIWTTVATGKRPADHGILGFDGVPGMTMKTLPNTSMRRTKAFWNILPDWDTIVWVVGWWVTWPADPVPAPGYIVSDRFAYTRMEAAVHAEALSLEDVYPPELLEELLPLVERPNQMDPQAARFMLAMSDEDLEDLVYGADYSMGGLFTEFKYAYQSDRSSVRMTLQLMRERPVDVTAVYLTSIDTVSHLFWHFTYPEAYRRFNIPEALNDQFREVIPKTYELADAYLGQLLEASGPGTTVLVVSDHGFLATGELPWSGGHVNLRPGAPPPGIFVAAGPGTAYLAAGGRRLVPNDSEHLHVLDILPLLLALRGVPAGEDMPGTAPAWVLAGGLASRNRVASHDALGTPWSPGRLARDPQGDRERLERLRSLGYMN